MRLLRFLFIFFGTAVLIVGSIFWLNRDTFITVFQNRPALLEGTEWVEKTYSLGGLVEYALEQPQHSSVVSLLRCEASNYRDTASDEHNGGFTAVSSSLSTRTVAASSILHQADRPIPAGTLSQLFLLAGFAEQVASGHLQPDQPVDPSHVSRFHLPSQDRRHMRAFSEFSEQHPAPTMEQLVMYLAHSHDPAAADYLHMILGPEYIVDLVLRLSGGNSEPPLPSFGLRLAAATHPSSTLTYTERLDALEALERAELSQLAMEKTLAQWHTPQEVDIPLPRLFNDQRRLNGMYSAIVPHTLVRLLADMFSGELLSAEVSRHLKRLLERSAEDRMIEPHIRWFAAHFDERMGYMGGWTLAQLADSECIRVQTVLFHDLPAGLWFHMNSNFMVRDFHHRLVYDTSLQDRALTLLTTYRSVSSETAGRQESAGSGSEPAEASLPEHSDWGAFEVEPVLPCDQEATEEECSETQSL